MSLQLAAPQETTLEAPQKETTTVQAETQAVLKSDGVKAEEAAFGSAAVAGEEEANTKKRKIVEQEDDQSGSGGQNVFELSGRRKVTVDTYKNHLLISVREFYVDENDGTEKPGKKGISLTLEQWRALESHMPAINRSIAQQVGGQKKKQ